VQTAGNTITAPAGWNLVLRQDTSSAISTVTYVKVAGSTEPASYTWSFGTAGEASGGIASYIGVNTTTPVDASHAQYNSSTSNVDNTGVTTTTANDMLVYAVGVIVATTVNVPPGFAQEWSTTSSSSTTSEMSQELFPSAGATGAIHGTHNGGANSNITFLIALKPR
jgi:predicted TIM-barrel enzyme